MSRLHGGADGAAPSVSQAGSLYDGQPLSYWVARAKGPKRAADQQTIAALVAGLGSERLSDRVAAADALETLGPAAKDAAPALAATFDHPHGWFRSACSDALLAIGPEAVPAILDAFRKGSPSVRMRAGTVLGAMGPAAKGAIPDLEKAINEGPADLAAQLTAFLGMIRPQAAAPAETAAAAAAVAIPPRQPAAILAPGEWPQFHGPARDSISDETRLLDKWPELGPKLLWKIEGLGAGLSSVAIVGGRLYTMGDRPAGDGGEQFVLAYDLNSQRPLWSTKIGPAFNEGPRSTPTVDGQQLYALGTEGDLVCLNTADGMVKWQKNLASHFGGQMMSGWKYSESPLVDGDRLIVTPGGADAMLAALDKHSGETIWKASVPTLGEKGKDGAAYASAVVAEIGGVRQYLQVVGRGLISVEAATGRFLWGYNRLASSIANIPSALVRGDYVFTTNSYRSGSALLQIARQADAFTAAEVYYLPARQFENHHGGVVAVGDYVYGASGQNRGELVCVELATGEVAWRQKPLDRGSAAVLYADGHILVRYDRGLVAWVKATPESFQLDGTLKPLTGDGPAWAHPVILGGRLYLRHGDILACYQLAR